MLNVFSAHILYEGELPPTIKTSFELVSLLKRKGSHADPLRVRTRIAHDRDTLEYLLYAEGYMEASIDIAPQGKDFVIHVQPGPRYRFADTQKPVDFSDIFRDQDRLLECYRDRGYPFPIVAPPSLKIDSQSQTVWVQFQTDPGERCRLGKLVIKGPAPVCDAVVHDLTTWRYGELYQEKKLLEFKRRLIETGLFSQVSVKPKPAQPGFCDILLKSKAAPARYFDVAVGLSSLKTLTGSFEWANKNIRNQGEELAFRMRFVSYIERAAELSYVFPLLYQHRVLLYASFLNENVNYESYVGTLGVLWEKRLYPHWTFNYGLHYADGYSTQTLYNNSDIPEIRRDRLSSLQPMVRLLFNHHDDLYAPTQGWQWMAEAKPFWGNRTALRMQTSLSHLARVKPEPYQLPAFVWFNKVSVGYIRGHNVPPPYRFYLGGIETMRSFPHHLVGDIDLAKQSLGTHQYQQWSTELRYKIREGLTQYRVGDEMTLNLYYEAAHVDGEQQRFFHGVGISISAYFKWSSQRIPVEFGMAFPLNPRTRSIFINNQRELKRKRIDDPVQFYMVVGRRTNLY